MVSIILWFDWHTTCETFLDTNLAGWRIYIGLYCTHVTRPAKRQSNHSIFFNKRPCQLDRSCLSANYSTTIIKSIEPHMRIDMFSFPFFLFFFWRVDLKVILVCLFSPITEMERITKQNRNHIQQTPLPNTEPRQLARASLLIDTNYARCWTVQPIA